MPLDWRIVAAAVAVLVVLGSGTLLAAQVQGDLDSGVAPFAPDVGSPAASGPLELNDLRLPENVPLEIPPGAEISPDLSRLTLPEGLELSIPDDLDLSGLDFELPQDFTLDLPEGTVFSPPGLELPEGATIRMPDGREFRLPPGSRLDLPPELVERLLEQGVRPGELGSARSIDVSGLPPGSTATLDPPDFEGGGSLSLPPGTTITLPDGRRFPFHPGALGAAASYLLPAGTRIDIPSLLEGGGSASFPVPRPGSPSQVGGEGALVDMITEITGMPARVRKGEPFTVSGYVRDPGGNPVAGAPVDVFMNETKRAPGVLVGQGRSDRSGTFVITLSLPSDKPARDYQLVNHAVAFTDALGRRWGDGWGDPPIATYASTALLLELPAEDGVGVRTPIAGVLADHTGAPVAGATIVLSVDGEIVGRPTTSAIGRFAFPHAFAAGTHRVDARFAGTANYEASDARGTIAITDLAIDVAPTLRAEPGDTVLFSGRVLDRGVAAPGRAIDLAFLGTSVDLVTDAAGRFSYAYATSSALSPGVHSVTYTLPGESARKLQTLEVAIDARLQIDAPTVWDVDVPIPVTIALRTADGTPVDNQVVRVTLTGPGGTTESYPHTAYDGHLVLRMSPLRASPGPYTITARAMNEPYVNASVVSHGLTLGLFEVLWSVPSTVIRGEEAGGALTVRYSGKPVAGASVALDFFGYVPLVTDENGRAEWSALVPADAPLGMRDVTAGVEDHATRSTVTSVAAKPDLEMDAPAAFVPGRPVDVKLTVRDDRGDPMPHQEISLRILRANGSSTTSVRTNARGVWSGPLDIEADRGDNVTLTAHVVAAGPYLGADETRVMSATATGFDGARWLLPAGIGLAALAGGGALYAYRRLPRRRLAAPPAPAAAVVAAPTLRAPDFDARFAIPDDEPAVWGVGEPLDVALRNRGLPGRFELAWTGGGATIECPGAHARETMRFDDQGEVALEARRAGADGMDAARASVRIVDYRKETAREFDVLLEKAQRFDPTLTKRSTPREIGWTLEMRLGEATRAHLEEIALVMEITNYSHYAVDRRHYLRFVRAARALDPLFEAQAGGA